MKENTSPPTVGKALNRERQIAFYDSVAGFHKSNRLAPPYRVTKRYSEWEFDFTLKNGMRLTLAEVCVRQWRERKVFYERFCRNQGAYPAPL